MENQDIRVENPMPAASEPFLAATPAEPVSPIRYFNVQQHGFSNGLLQIEKDDYERFIENYQKAEDCETQLAQLANERRQTSELRGTLRRELTEVDTEIAKLEQEMVEARQGADAKKAEVERKQTRLELVRKEMIETLDAHRSDYVLFNGILFLVAAFVFMLADVGISYSVVATNLKMQGWDGVFFSIGLGLLPIALKPLYDRIAEKRLHHDQFMNKKNALPFILVSVLAALVIFACAIAFALLRTNIYSQILQSSEPPLPLSFEEKSAPENGGQASEDANPFKDPYAAVGLVCAGVVFIFGGTICLSIAIPVLYRNNRKRRYTKNEKRELSNIDNLETERAVFCMRMEKAANAITSYEKRKRDIIDQLNGLPSTKDYEGRKVDLYNSLSEAVTKRRIYAYRDAYLRGVARRSLYTSDELRRLAALINEKEEETEDHSENSGGRPGKTRLRPYLAVRRMLNERMRRSSGTSLSEDAIINV